MSSGERATALTSPLVGLDPRQLALCLNHRHPSRLDRFLRADLQRIIAATPQPTAPFVPAPPDVLCTGPYVHSFQASDGIPVASSPDELSMHELYTGRTGGGKSVLVLNRILGVLLTVRLWLLDLKADFGFLLGWHPGMLHLSHDTPFSPLRVPSYLSRAEHTQVFTSTFTSALYAAESTKQVLTEAFDRSYADHETPSLDDLKQAVGTLGKKHDTYARRDALRATMQRLDRFAQQYPSIASSRSGFGVETLCAYSLYVDAPLLTELEEFLWSNLIHHLYLYKRLRNDRALSHLVVMDEGRESWSTPERSTHRIGGQGLLVNLQPKMRESGIGMLITTNSYRTTDDVLKSNTYQIAITRLSTNDDVRAVSTSLGLTKEQAAYLAQLPPGEVILHRGNWPHPILARYPNIAIDKTITPGMLAAAKQRADHLTPRAPVPPAVSAARPAPTSSPSSAPPTVPKAAPPTPPSPNDPRPALSDNDAALLRAAGKGVNTTLALYQQAGLARQSGDRSKDRLQNLGFLRAERARTTAGRGGMSVLLAPTTLGYAWLGTTPPRATCGGDSLAHRYYTTMLARFLPGAQVEFLLGTGKSVDLLLRYDKTKHARFGRFLDRYTQSPLHQDELVALEVEVSDPTKTGISNVRRNHEAGVSQTILAVLPTAFDAITQRVSRELAPERKRATIIVDLLQLLDALRQPLDTIKPPRVGGRAGDESGK